jgi:superfamily I DNA/RNA helicase
MQFKDWLNISEMAEKPQPGPDWGYSHSSQYQGRPTKNQWIKRGQRAVPAFTTDDELYDPHRPHSDYGKAAYKLNVPDGQPPQPQQPKTQQVTQPRQQSPSGTPSSNNLKGLLAAGLWVHAKSKATTQAIPAPNLDLAIKKYDENSFMFVILDVDEQRLVSRGLIPTSEVRDSIESQKKQDGTYSFGNKPSEVLAAITPEKEGGGGNTIPDHHITDEQQKIEAKFVNMMQGGNNHMMINALAGSGKTTMLKHLAHKYSKGQKWLYLVFNSKNKAEAKDEFPSNVQVETTNGWAGREVLGKNRVKPTDRVVDFTYKEKAKMVADTPAFKEVTKSLNIPDQDEEYGSDPRSMRSTEKNLWYTLRQINSEFKTEVVKLLGLVKSFAVDPRQTEQLEANVKNVMDQYDMNTDLESVKEKIEKTKPWVTEYLDDLMGESFMDRDFTEEMVKATVWMMNQVMPHASQDKFTATTDKYKDQEIDLGSVRDFDDDLWFSAIHADELNWPKYDVVLADEVQDFNAAQMIMIKKLAENGAKIVAVGDPNQAIYRFRGADNGAFTGMSQMLTDLSDDKNVEQELTKNFRSRQAIIDLANDEGRESDHVSNLVKGRPFSEDPGRIGKGKATKYEQTYDDSFESLKSEMKDMGEIKQTAYLARTNEPLVHASLRLMKEGIPFIILGKDLATDLIKHIDKLADMFFIKKADPVSKLLTHINDYNTEQQEKNAGKVALAARMKGLKETSEALTAALEQFTDEKGDGTMFEFNNWLKAKFGGLELDKGGRDGDRQRAEYKRKTKEQNPVILSTVHKSKGLQFQRVYILRDDLWPHPRSTREADLAQELNNRYIGRTRAEDELHILDLEGQPGYKPKGE